MGRVYLDHSATTPLRPEVLAAMMPYFADQAGNASSLHMDGQRAKRALETARGTVARTLGVQPEEVYFNGGGTEGDNHALTGMAWALRDRGRHLITTAVEHHAVLHTCEWLETQGYAVTYVPVDGQGMVDVDALRGSIRPDTILISVMLANNEVGTIQPVGEITQMAAQYGITCHTDAVQAIGKMPVRVDELGVQMLSLTAHKFGGPKGVGALVVRRGTSPAPLVHGGGQERGLRPGTQNVAGIVGLAEALRLTHDELAVEAPRLAALRDLLETGLLDIVPGVQVNGHPERRLPNILNVSFAGVDGESLLMALDVKGVAVSTGAACSAGSAEPSHVLRAMGLSVERAGSSLRYSLGHMTTEEEIERALDATVEVVARLRAYAGAGETYA
jgi:cysteine desulfurase